MENKIVSIIIPTFERPAMLKRCIESVLGQTYRNIEIIVVDDNDSDTGFRRETEEIMKKYSSESNIIYIKHDKNSGGSAARNTGWRNSNGEYITFLDDDDVIASNKIELMVEKLEKLDDSWGMCYSAYEIIKENGKSQQSFNNVSGDCYIRALMRTFFMGSGSNLLLRKSVIDDIGGYNERFSRNQDIEFLVRATEKYKIAYVEKCLLTIYQEGNRKKRTFGEMEEVTNFYLKTFNDRINNLSKKNRNRVISVISLERFRLAVYDKKITQGIKILINNKVSIIIFIKYLSYLMKRYFTNKSYGFYIK